MPGGNSVPLPSVQSLTCGVVPRLVLEGESPPMRPMLLLALVMLAAPGVGHTAPLTADEAVKIALQKNSSVINAEASVLSARSGLWSAYSGVVPSVSGDYSIQNTKLDPNGDLQAIQFGSSTLFYRTRSFEQTNKSPSLSASWSVLDLSNWSQLSSARQSMRGARLSKQATRNDIALEARRRFYGVVRAIRLAEVASSSLKLARDDERRVKALYEVGSVSKSDLLKARVRTSQSQLDSLLSNHGIISARISLATLLTVPESDMADVDTTLSGSTRTFEMATVLSEAGAARPDLKASELNVRAAQAGLNAARFQRLPSVRLSGSLDYSTRTRTQSQRDFYTDSTGTTLLGVGRQDTETKSDPSRSAALFLSIPIFDGFQTDSRIASARANLLHARATRDALVRSLEGEVRLTLLGYQEATEREDLARQTLASAAENLNLVQQKYNVGSATILDLIDSQVQLQRAQSDLVSALADIRVAEAAVDRVRGKAE